MWRADRGRIGIAVFATLATFVALGTALQNKWNLVLSWWTVFDGALTVGTLAVGLLLWKHEHHERWLEELPKRLTARFMWRRPDGPPIEVMRCELATLAHVGDARNWAQQLGSQMAGQGAYTARLSLDAQFDVSEAKLIQLEDGGDARLFEVTLWLQALDGDRSRLPQLAGDPARTQPWVLWRAPVFRDPRDDSQPAANATVGPIGQAPQGTP
jgi:hypothetical protein